MALIIRRLGSLFTESAPAPSTTAEEVEERQEDALLDIVRQHPQAGVWFIEVAMLLAGLSGLAVSIPCAGFLVSNWAVAGLCSRSVRLWIVLHCALQLVQAPVRLLFVLRVRRAESSGAREVQDCVERFTSAPAWKASRWASNVSRIWLGLGVVMLLATFGTTSLGREQCPGLFYWSWAVVALAGVRMAVTMQLFFRCFPDPMLPEQERPQGVSLEAIQKMPVFAYSPDDLDGAPETGCAVCLCEFVHDESLRQLPCGHSFHCPCIDKWLLMSKVCPLCNHDVEAAPTLWSAKVRRRCCSK